MAQQRPSSFIPDTFIPDEQTKPSSFIPDSDEPAEDKSWWNKFFEPLAPDIGETAEDAPLFAKVIRQGYTDYVRPLSSPFGAVTTGVAGPVFKTAAALAPRIVGGAIGALGGYGASQVPGDIASIAEEPNERNILDLMEHGGMAVGLPFGTRMALRNRTTLPKPKLEARRMEDIHPIHETEQRLLTGGFDEPIPEPIRQLTGKIGHDPIDITIPPEPAQLPAGPQPRGLLPAEGQTTITGNPRFVSGRLGMADESLDYPIDLADWAKLRHPEGGTLLDTELGELGFLPPEVAATRGLGSAQLQMPISGRFRPYELQAGAPIQNIRQPYAPVGEPRAFIPQGMQSNRIRPDATLEQPLGGRVVEPPIRPSQSGQPPFRPSTINEAELAASLRGALPGPSGTSPNIPPFRATTIDDANIARRIREGQIPSSERIPKQVRKQGQHRKSIAEILKRDYIKKAKTVEEAANKLNVVAQTTGDTTTKQKITELLGLPRALKSMELTPISSAAFRQGSPLFGSKEWFKAWDDMVGSWGKEKAFEASTNIVKSNPNYELGQRAGLKLTNLGNILRREEEAISSWIEKPNIMGFSPGRASNRSYTAFLNRLRMDTFSKLIDSARRSNIDVDNDPRFTNLVANYVNNATGRGDLGGAERYARELATVLFSPRNMAAKAQFMNPVNYFRFRTKGDRFVTKEYWKSLGRMTEQWGVFSALGALAGGDIDLSNPTSSDFGKTKIGDTRFDPGAGMLQQIVLLNRLKSGGTTSSTSGEFRKFGEGPFSQTPLSLLAEFIRNKANPVIGYGMDFFDQRDYQKYNLTEETLGLIMPMMIEDIKDAAKEEPELIPLVTLIDSLLPGIGVQSYSGNGGGGLFKF